MVKTLLTAWKKFLLRKLDIREGEFRHVWLIDHGSTRIPTPPE